MIDDTASAADTATAPKECAWCERHFVPRESHPYQKFCSDSCRVTAERRRKRYLLGPCPTCGQIFPSRHRGKQFCSLACYLGHPSATARLREFNEERTAKADAALVLRSDATSVRIEPGKVSRLCPQCEKPTGHRKRRYCSSDCRRLYFAARFDRFIASPEKLALPQCYDEFLMQEKLPCLVEGCEWVGQNLSYHVNVAHGIKADQFRELAGFNMHTGLIGTGLRKFFSDKAKKFWEDGKWGPNAGGHEPFAPGHPQAPYQLRSEGAEHVVKARAIRMTSGPSQPPVPCRQCGKLVTQPAMGRCLYCSVRCRTRFYQEQGGAELRCGLCGTLFFCDEIESRSFAQRASHLLLHPL